MKIRKLLVLIMFCFTLILITGFSNPKAEDNVTPPGLQEFSTRLLHNEINNAIYEKYGTDWIFNPEKVCGVKGNVSIEGVLHRRNEIKNIKINFQKQKSEYKMIDISEVKSAD
ncbi:hypothetical protein [Paenibacillus rhizophilus]|uniref:DUF3889 domain-containing protein n=1 Tax=Paenibacillus rhizophilus TaxID=1850366 RepID=A0A3N9Q7R3_9BACL|nr:hypothetical protein [Paenibacillus rhizophilus]RQW13566.1 hypothetical protein EH198_03930 [Paenibacillus rhizophilus]